MKLYTVRSDYPRFICEVDEGDIPDALDEVKGSCLSTIALQKHVPNTINFIIFDDAPNQQASS